MITTTHKGKYYDVEYSIVNISELEGELRIDAEYYDPFYLKNEEKIKKKKWECMEKLLKERPQYGTTPPGGIFESSGIPFIRSQDFKDGFVETNQFCSTEFHNKNKKSTVLAKDILLAAVGATIGEVGIYLFDEEANINQNISRLRISGANQFYVFSFMKTRFFINQLYRFNTGNAQSYLNTFQVMSFKIPIPSDIFQKYIEKLVLKAYEERQKEEQFYKQAEEILLEELGLKNWKPKTKKIKIGGQEFKEEENIFIKMLSDVIKADRMDAEYWEPKYDEIEELIKNYKNGYDYLPNLVTISKRKIKVKNEETYNYIELADINPNLGVVNQTKQIQGKDLPSRARMEVRSGCVIMSSVKGSIDKIALIDFDKNNLVASTGFFVFKENKINKETLLVLLKILAKRYLIREAQGTILTAIPYDSLNRIVIPKIDQQIQKKISQLIQQSFEARENSKKLLEIAERTIEIYIEKDEEEGLKYAKNKLNELNIKIN